MSNFTTWPCSGGDIALVSAVGCLAHLRPGVGDPEVLVTALLDQGDAVALLETDGPGAQNRPSPSKITTSARSG